jgi:hypothetical protein
MENSILKRRVMIRIYIEYFKHLMYRHWERFLVALIAADILIFVSLKNVYVNMPKDSALNSANYLFSAVRDTEMFLQFALAYAVLRTIFSISKTAYRNIPKIGRNLRLIKA